MKQAEKKIHSFAISFLLTMVLWVIVTQFIIAIEFHEFILIEILAAFGNIFSIFIKDKFQITNSKNQQDNESK
mgnify:CR=1 FL=1|tara:strand:- start:4085 stop:4303 length:219 start_codon:yes stop_codon:yes gene_type:complete